MRSIKGVVSSKTKQCARILAETGIEFLIEDIDNFPFNIGDEVDVVVDFTNNKVHEVRTMGMTIDEEDDEPLEEESIEHLILSDGSLQPGDNNSET